MISLLDEIEDNWQSCIAGLGDDELDEVVRRWDQIWKLLVGHKQVRNMQKENRERNDKTNDSADAAIPSEVIRQVVPFLTAKEVGRFLVLTSKSLLQQVGSEMAWKGICEKTWHQQDHTLLFSNPLFGALGTYENYFCQRHKQIALVAEDLTHLDVPILQPFQMCMLLDMRTGNKVMISQEIQRLDDLCTLGCTTIDLEEPIEVAQLPKAKAHGWNLPNIFDEGDCKTKLQLFRLGSNDDAPGTGTPVLLETDFSWWRGWARHGEMTFLQRQRTAGLRLTDRGQWIQHRIAECRHPQWVGYLGLQFKIVMVCERLAAESVTRGEGDSVASGFTKVRIEAIRLHESSYGNIQHHLFRKDQGWHKHGVTLLHLLNELC